ncbi:MAG TPA: sigma-70 family RNA polymerase sigma factor [Thermoanaerobaculia bacterium]|nr:sigma-70 family RNA polymerase sigma factor [Thermoanaerobaculia bacterium]
MSAGFDDRQLIERIALQDQDAFRQLYDRYGGPVLSYVRMLAREQELSEDVVQEVFLSVWRKAPSFRPDRGDVPAWLYTIARNKLVDLWRRRSTRGDKEDTSIDLTRFDSPVREDEVRVVSLAVRKALSALKREQRVALELAYFGGLTYEETAARLGLPLGTLKSRIRAGLASLRQILSATEPSRDDSPSEAPPS